MKSRLERLGAILATFCASAMFCSGSAHGQDVATSPGRDIAMSKCFQCHTDSMFRDQRQERRSWEAAIYRMIGRGGLYTQEEIKLMADYLGTEFGPNAKPTSTLK